MTIPPCKQPHVCLGLAFLFTLPFSTITTDGSPPVTTHESQLTHDGFPKRDPVFWPDGKELLYTVEAQTGHMRIVRMNLKTGEVSQFDERPDLSDREMSVSADGRVYAYNVVSGLSSKIHVVDNVRERRVTMPQMGKKTWSNWPNVSPDGTRVLFTEGAAVIYSFDLLTANGRQSVTRLSPFGATSISDYWPRFSPDGETIVFTSNRDDDFEIYVMRNDGSLPQRLTHSPGIDMHPVFSPDGKRIAFTSNRDGNYEIYVMDADGGNATRVTSNPERDDYVCWTLAGDAVVYVSEQKGRFDLFQRSLNDRARFRGAQREAPGGFGGLAPQGLTKTVSNVLDAMTRTRSSLGGKPPTLGFTHISAVGGNVRLAATIAARHESAEDNASTRFARC